MDFNAQWLAVICHFIIDRRMMLFDKVLQL